MSSFDSRVVPERITELRASQAPNWIREEPPGMRRKWVKGISEGRQEIIHYYESLYCIRHIEKTAANKDRNNSYHLRSFIDVF